MTPCSKLDAMPVPLPPDAIQDGLLKEALLETRPKHLHLVSDSCHASDDDVQISSSMNTEFMWRKATADK